MIWNFTDNCLNGAVYGCVDALKYIHENGQSITTLKDILTEYFETVGIIDENGDVLEGIIQSLLSFQFIDASSDGKSFIIPSMIVTSSGKRLISSFSTSEIQKCFCDAIERIHYRADNGKDFSPFSWTINIVEELQKSGEQAELRCSEFAYFVQTSSPADDVCDVVKQIIAYRNKELVIDRKDKDVLFEFADLNIRCLRATGLFRKKGRGIELINHNARLCNL